MGKWKLPRAWSDPEGISSTKVLYDPGGRGKHTADEPEVGPMIFMHTNLGWIGPLSVEPEDGQTLEQRAEEIADGYDLQELGRERAIWLLGFEGREDEFEGGADGGPGV